jgi:hypothetical protein
MRRVPRGEGSVAAALAVNMTYVCGSCSVAVPPVTRVVSPRREGRAVGLRASQDVMIYRLVADAGNSFSDFSKRSVLGELRRTSVEVVRIGGDQRSGDVVPGAGSDAIPCMDSWSRAIGSDA